MKECCDTCESDHTIDHIEIWKTKLKAEKGRGAKLLDTLREAIMFEKRLSVGGQQIFRHVIAEYKGE